MPEAMRKVRKARLKARIQNRNFEMKTIGDRFKMIIRERDAMAARRLFAKLTTDEQLDFIRKHYRGVKVAFDVKEVETLSLNPIRLIKAGYKLYVSPVIRDKKFWVTLAHYPQQPTPEQILHKIQHHLPTVKVL